MSHDLIFTSDRMGGEDTMDCRTKLILSVDAHDISRRKGRFCMTSPVFLNQIK
jgi:hypothetical protein